MSVWVLGQHVHTKMKFNFQGFLGMYFTLADNHAPIVENLSFLPILSLTIYIVAYSIGIGPLPWALIGELLPIEVKTIASPIPTSFCWILMFLITRYRTLSFKIYKVFGATRVLQTNIFFN